MRIGRLRFGVWRGAIVAIASRRGLGRWLFAAFRLVSNRDKKSTTRSLRIIVRGGSCRRRSGRRRFWGAVAGRPSPMPVPRLVGTVLGEDLVHFGHPRRTFKVQLWKAQMQGRNHRPAQIAPIQRLRGDAQSSREIACLKFDAVRGTKQYAEFIGAAGFKPRGRFPQQRHPGELKTLSAAA